MATGRRPVRTYAKSSKYMPPKHVELRHVHLADTSWRSWSRSATLPEWAMEPARGIGQVVDVDGVSYKLSKGYAVFVKVSSSSQRQPCTWKKEWSWAEFRERVATIQRGAHQADTSSDQLGALSRFNIHQHLRPSHRPWRARSQTHALTHRPSCPHAPNHRCLRQRPSGGDGGHSQP